MNKIKIGDAVESKHGITTIKSIEMIAPDTSFADDHDNIPMQEIWACDKDRCVFDLDNSHWAYGDQIDIPASESNIHPIFEQILKPFMP